MNRKQEKRRVISLDVTGLTVGLVGVMEESLGFANRGVKDLVLTAEFRYERPARKAMERLGKILSEEGETREILLSEEKI